MVQGDTAGKIGMVVGGLGILVAGLVDAYTDTLLVCGSIVLSSGIIAVAIAGRLTRCAPDSSKDRQDAGS
jgi:hypothetical protein